MDKILIKNNLSKKIEGNQIYIVQISIILFLAHCLVLFQ